jgi:basic membrane protein A
VQFCHATGTGAADSGLSNFHNYFVNIYEARYLAGIAAGMKMQEMIDNGTITADKAVIGYVAAFYFEEIISGFTAFYLGAKSVCPSATMKTLKVDSWSNPSQEAQVAQTLIDDGCVIISQHSDNTTPATTAEANGVFHCGYNADMSEAAPNASLISARADWSVYLIYAINCMINGEPIATDWSKGLADGAVFLSPLNTAIAAPGTQEAIDTATQKIISGEVHVFDGPLTGYNVFNPDDKLNVPAGEFVEESVTRSAPYFAYIIDGITLLDA